MRAVGADRAGKQELEPEAPGVHHLVIDQSSHGILSTVGIVEAATGEILAKSG